MWVAKPNYRHQKRQREAQRLTRQAEKLQKRQAARGETGEPGDAVAGAPLAESTAADTAMQKPAG
jgi:hypothetical protein